MIFFDTTKTGHATHRSGLNRVSTRLRAALANAATACVWDERSRAVLSLAGTPPSPADWFVTSELFSEAERPGFSAWLDTRPVRCAAIYHDAIPLRFPRITWPQSVARQPAYLKMLARFDRVWAVSRASRDELLGFWRWQGVAQPPPVDVLTLGADFNGAPRVAARDLPPVPRLLCVGILEPRKNQRLLLEACAELWAGGLEFELDLVGRVNPHFGAPVVARIRELVRAHGHRLHWHERADDAQLAELFRTARATAFPTIAEGCGLPLLESLWMGVPCLHSDLPVLHENAAGGGCRSVATNDVAAWREAVREIVTSNALAARLTAEAVRRPLPTWQEAAATLGAALA
jgi:glycosyltransferase involved in cell wall biosynthesis